MPIAPPSWAPISSTPADPPTQRRYGTGPTSCAPGSVGLVAARTDFWLEDGAGGRPAALLTADGRPVPHLAFTTASLLDTGLLGGGALAPGLLDAAQTDQLAGLLGSPAMDSG